MENKIKNFIGMFVEYIITTWVNKLTAIILIAASSVPMLLDGDGTAFVFMLIFAIPLFFSKRNWMMV